MVNAEGKINFDEIFASLFVINVSILMYKKPPEIQYNTKLLIGSKQVFLSQLKIIINFYPKIS